MPGRHLAPGLGHVLIMGLSFLLSWSKDVLTTTQGGKGASKRKRHSLAVTTGLLPKLSFDERV